MGANYCDNNYTLILAGHIGHGIWGAYCMTCVILATNRCIEIHSSKQANELFKGNRVWLWLIAPLVYGFLFSTLLDVPPVYNSVWSVYLFQIDFSPGAKPVTDWFCFQNSCWVMTALIISYSLLLYQLKRRTTK